MSTTLVTMIYFRASFVVLFLSLYPLQVIYFLSLFIKLYIYTYTHYIHKLFYKYVLGLNACTKYAYLYFISYPSILLIGSILLIVILSLQLKILVLLSVMCYSIFLFKTTILSPIIFLKLIY